MLNSFSINRNLVVMHATVMIWGFTGILGNLISISAIHLVWYRVFIALITLYIYFKAIKADLSVSRKAFLRLFFTGAIVGAHWILFFQSIKSSTVSVALVCLSSVTLFTAILEPLIKQKKVSGLQILTGLAIISGIFMIFKFETRYTLGISLGLGCSFCASLFSIINSRQIKNRPAPLITFYELAGALFWISVYLLLSGGFNSSMALSSSDLIYLLLLGTICTSVAYVAGVSVMKELSAFRVALITNLEPVYGIILAFLIFGKSEHMTPGFYGGTVIILSAIFLYPYVRNKLSKRTFTTPSPMG